MAWKASVLVVANVTADSDELLEALRARAQRGPTRFTLLMPATGGVRGGREAAERRLEAALERLRGAGLEIEGQIGDPDPMVAVQEAWDPTAFDDIVVSTLPTGASKWLLVDLPHRVERLTGVHVAHVVATEKKEPPPSAPAPPQETYGVLAPLAPLWKGSPPERRGA